MLVVDGAIKILYFGITVSDVDPQLFFIVPDNI